MDELKLADGLEKKTKSEQVLEKYIKSRKLRRDKDVLDVNLSGQNLTEVTSSLNRYKNLTRLWLHSNSLRELSFIHNSYALSELYLQYNLIKSIVGCMHNLTNLRVLLLHGNEIFDLKSTVKELNYLKDLRNLSLFENPIAFEKNYSYSIIQQCQKLEIFDRNTITENDRKIRNQSSISTNRKSIESTYYSLRESKATSYLDSNRSRSEREKQQTNSKSSHHPQLTTDKQVSSIREFSYFDWSKVPADAATRGTTAAESSLASVRSNNNNDKLSSLPSTERSQSKFDRNQLSQLPQIVTIRFF